MFRRLDASTGAVRWETNVRGSASQYFFHGDVFVGPDRIIASADVAPNATMEAGVHAFDTQSGRQLWKHAEGRGVLGAVIGLGTHIFSYTLGGDLLALDAETGRTAWRHALKPPGWESPAAADGRVFAASSEGTAYAFTAATGRIAWQQEIGAPVSTSVRVAESGVYVGTADGALHRLVADTGARLASLKLDDDLKPARAPVVTRDAVLVLLADQGADYRALVAVDPELTSVKWRERATDRWSTSRIFVQAETIFLGTPSGEVAAYCTADGRQAWSHKLAEAPIRVIGGSGQTLYVGTTRGTLYAVHAPASCP